MPIVRAGIGAASAGRLLERAWTADVVRTFRPDRHGEPEGPDAVRLIAAGKTAPAMATAAWRLLGSRIRGGLVVLRQSAHDPEHGRRVISDLPGDLPPSFESIGGGHPVPTPGSEQAGRRALAIAGELRADETLVVLLSGGASALMAVPAADLTLDDKRATTDRLLRAGADIHALNTVRKHLSAIKGGWLAARAPGSCRTFAISDVVGDDLSAIGSGPAVADRTTFGDALEIVRRFGGEAAYPRGVVTRLTKGARGDVVETPKPGDRRLARAAAAVIGSRREAMDGAAREAETLGYHVVRIDDPVVGEARLTAPSHLGAVVRRAAGVARPACIVSSGETTVRVTGRGTGGRNQEFALASAAPVASLGGAAAVASVGTDGVDGPTDAAGAIIDQTTVERARSAGLSPDAFLDDNNAYAFFAALGDLIHTGPTDTNVGDLQIILLG